MKKEYKMPQMEVVEIQSKSCLLAGSTQTPLSVNVDEWEED